MKKLMYFALALGLLSSCSQSKSANEMLADIEKDVVDFMPKKKPFKATQLSKS